MLRRLIRWSQPIFLLVALAAIGWFLAKQWPTLRTYPWRLDWGWLLATCLFTWASWAVEIAIWRHLLATLGGNLPYWTAARIWFLSAIVRYIPGNVWQPLSLTLYCRRHGVAPEAAVTSIVLFQVVTLLATAPILVLYFVWIDTKSLAAQWISHFPPALLWLALLPLLAFLLRPQWLVEVLNWALLRLQRPPLAVKLTSGNLLTLLLVALFDWFLWGSVFAAFTFAVAGDAVGSGWGSNVAIAPLLIASYPIASVVGFLSLITPSGFGVREGAFYLLLTPQIAGSVVTVVALGIRVWGIINEVILALISAPYEKASAAGASVPPASVDVPVREPVIADLTRAHRRETL
jgi:uncharacterized membrane protein YbhN (UPF0104 family)